MTRVGGHPTPQACRQKNGREAQGIARVGLGKEVTSDDVVRGQEQEQEQEPGQGQGVRVHGSLFIQAATASSFNLHLSTYKYQLTLELGH